jgi:TetR/AcrR family transcriptional regulator
MSELSQSPPSRGPRNTATSLLNAALRLFAEGDPRRITVQQIADEARVSVGSIYVHYGSKDGLYLAVLDRALERSGRYTLNRRWSASPLQRVLNVGDAYVDFALENPESFRVIVHWRPLSDLSTDLAKMQAGVEQRIRREVDAIAADLQAAMDAGEIMRLPVREVLTYLWASWAGVLGMCLRDDAFRIAPEEARRVLLGAQWILARGIRPGDADAPLA